jgi:hypothetical protein
MIEPAIWNLPDDFGADHASFGMYGPPPGCKQKREGQGWSAQMYTAFDGVKGLLARMECATLSSHLVRQSWKTSSESGF